MACKAASAESCHPLLKFGAPSISGMGEDRHSYFWPEIGGGSQIKKLVSTSTCHGPPTYETGSVYIHSFQW